MNALAAALVLTVLALLPSAPAAAQEALSGDGGVRARAQAQPPSLLLLDAASGTRLKTLPLPAPVAALGESPAHEAFVIAPMGIAELWLVYWADPPPFTGLVHNWREGQVEAVRPARFPIRRIRLSAPVAELAVAPGGWEVLARPAGREGELVVVNLDVQREIKRLRLPGHPRPGRAQRRQVDGRTVLAIPDAQAPVTHRVEPGTWRVLPQR